MNTKTVVRKTYIKAEPTEEQRKYLDGVSGDILARSAAILREMVHCKHPKFDERQPNDTLKVASSSIDKDLAPFYDGVVANSHSSRTIRGPFISSACKIGRKSQEPLEQCCRKLLDCGKLPMELPEFNHNYRYDFASFQVAVSSLKSWHECNESTKANFQAQTKKVAEMQPTSLVNELEFWLKKHKLSITKRVVKKFSKFKWDARLRNYPFDELKVINDNAGVWLKVFEWKLESDRLTFLRPTSALTLPGNTMRDIPYGSNYQFFSICFEQNKVFVVIDGHKIATLPSNYFRNLKITDISKEKTINYRFEYDRGNKSPLSEHVVAELKEITLFKKNGEYYFGLPLNVQVPSYDGDTEQFLDYFYATDQKATCPNVKIMGVDLGVTNPATCSILEDGKIAKRFFATEIKDHDFHKALKNMSKQISEAHAALEEVHELNKSFESFSKEWIKNCEPFAGLMRKLCTKFREICRWDLRTDRAVSTETLLQIRVYKRFLGLLHRWTDFGTNPAEKGQHRNGFQKHNKRLENLKKDFRKKVGCAIVRLARQHNVSVIAIEDLKDFSPDQTNAAQKNELLMLWGKGEIGHWINHFAEQYGISVIGLNPRLTSQTDSETGLFGYRDKFDSEKLYVERRGKVETVHADQVAGDNLALRAYNRCTNEPFVLTCPFEDGHALWWKEEKKEESKYQKIRKTRLIHRFGNHLVMIDKEGQLKSLKLSKVPTVQKTKVYLYSLNGVWVSDDVRRKHQDDLGARAGVIKIKFVEKLTQKAS